MRPFILAIGFLITSVFSYREDEIIRNTSSPGPSYRRGDESVNLSDDRNAFWNTSGIRDAADYKIDKGQARNVFNLYGMLQCMNDPCPPLSYVDYGCYCGLTLNETGYTVDEIDTCCLHHDRCYEQSECIYYTKYWFPYLWQCFNGTEAQCDSDQGYLAWLFSNQSCNKRICECDRVLTKCLRQYPCPAIKAECRPPL